MCQCPDNQQGLRAATWASNVFDDCVYTDAEVASLILGLASIVCWLCAQAPQLRENYLNKTGSSLSLIFLIEWFLGDLTNLVGSLLTHQLPTQVYTAVYFCVMDCVMLGQFTYYSKIYPRINAMRMKRFSDDDSSQSLSDPLIDNDAESISPGHSSSSAGDVKLSNGTATGSATKTLAVASSLSVLAVLGLVGLSGCNSRTHGYQSDKQALLLSSMKVGEGRMLLAPMEPECEAFPISEWERTAGRVLGWVSAVVYLSSRVPQIIKNHKRKSVQGLSIVMFLCAFLGNVTYGMSIFLRPMSWEYFFPKLPWVIGSIGTCGFDFFIVTQFFMFKNSKPDISEVFE